MMGQTPEQPEQVPTALPPTEPAPAPAMLEYRGLVNRPAGVALPWFVWVGCTLACFGACGLVAGGCFLLLLIMDLGGGRHDGELAIAAIFVGAAILALEYVAVKRRNGTCAVVVGILAFLAGVLLVLAAVFTPDGSSTPASLLVALAAVAMLCGVVHLVWDRILQTQRFGR